MSDAPETRALLSKLECHLHQQRRAIDDLTRRERDISAHLAIERDPERVLELSRMRVDIRAHLNSISHLFDRIAIEREHTALQLLHAEQEAARMAIPQSPTAPLLISLFGRAIRVLRFSASRRIERPPLATLGRIVRALFTTRTYNLYFQPIVADTVHEWQQAHIAGERRRAWYIKNVLGRFIMLSHITCRLPLSMLKFIGKLWGLVA